MLTINVDSATLPILNCQLPKANASNKGTYNVPRNEQRLA